ncbi:MAG: DUF222 domain-containing protein [Acidimicrobiales bacterium]
MDSAAEPVFSDERLGGKIAALMAAVRDLETERDHPHLAADVLVMQHQLEQAHRRLGAARIDNLARVEAERLHRLDGHRSVKAHARHGLKISPEEASRLVKAAHTLRDLPEVAAALRSGRIGLDHVQILARVHANPRIKEKVPARQDKFLRWADEESFDDFRIKVLDWERATDLDGGFRDNKRNHDNRNVRLVHNSLEGTWELSGHFAADQGVRVWEIFDHFIDAEWRTDWAAAREKRGESATISDLKRTDAQRRADAFVRMCNDAAGAPPGTGAPRIVHNIVWSAETYRAMVELLGSDDAARDTHWSATLTDPKAQRGLWCNPDTYRCSTLDGVPLEPVEQFFSSLANEIRRVIVNTKGVVIDLGRKARLFTGSARHAAQLQSPHCVWPGCDHPTTRCEVDHLHDYNNGGPTDPANGAPLCGFHNRWKQKGFSVTRDPVTGRWRTYRPDGSPIR